MEDPSGLSKTFFSHFDFQPKYQFDLRSNSPNRIWIHIDLLKTLMKSADSDDTDPDHVHYCMKLDKSFLLHLDL